MTPERLHVAVIGHTAVTSGGELALSRVLPILLADETLRITVILGEDGPLVPLLRSQGARVVILPLAAGVRTMDRHATRSGSAARRAALPLMSYILRLASFLKAERVDLVHTNTLKAALYGGAAGRLAGTPVLWQLRDRLAADYLPRRTARVVGLLGYVLPRQIAANSRSTASTLPAGLADRVQVVADCVGPEAPGPAPGDDHFRSGTDHVLRIGMMGRLAPWKGQLVALEAFAVAFDRRPDVRLVFVGSAMFGESAYLAQLETRVAQLGLGDLVEFRGFRADIWAEYADFDIAVHASVIPEPFGQVVIEAMHAGVPVVAADAGGPAEIITHDVDGLLTRAGDHQALANAMRRLAHDPGIRHRLAAAGRVRAAYFTAEATAGSLIDLYRTSTGPRRQPRPGLVALGRPRRGTAASALSAEVSR